MLLGEIKGPALEPVTGQTRTLPLQNAVHKPSQSLDIEQDTLGHHLTP
jgi:hypothetical protein